MTRPIRLKGQTRNELLGEKNQSEHYYGLSQTATRTKRHHHDFPSIPTTKSRTTIIRLRLVMENLDMVTNLYPPPHRNTSNTRRTVPSLVPTVWCNKKYMLGSAPDIEKNAIDGGPQQLKKKAGPIFPPKVSKLRKQKKWLNFIEVSRPTLSCTTTISC